MIPSVAECGFQSLHLNCRVFVASKKSKRTHPQPRKRRREIPAAAVEEAEAAWAKFRSLAHGCWLRPVWSPCTGNSVTSLQELRRPKPVPGSALVLHELKSFCTLLVL